MRYISCVLSVMALWIGTFSPSATATSYVPQSWQSIALDAHFIGIVECTTAGGLVAEFNVIETWHSIEDVTSMRLRLHRDYWGPQYSMVMIGERFVLFANKINNEKLHQYTPTEFYPVPLWLRYQVADYGVGVFGMRSLTIDQQPFYDSGITSPDEFKKSVQQFLNASPEEQSFPILKFNVITRLPAKAPDAKRLAREDSTHRIHKENRLFHLRGRIEHAKSIKAILDEIIAMNFTNEQEFRQLLYPFQWRNYYHTPDFTPLLEQADTSLSEHAKNSIEKIIAENKKEKIKAEEMKLNPPEPWMPPKPSSSQSAMEGYRKVISRSEEPSKELGSYDDAFKMLSQFDPDFVSDLLCAYSIETDPTIKPGSKYTLNQDLSAGYRQVSAFAFYCKTDRENQFNKLYKKGKDPYVRTAGAVFLSFENEKAGLAALKKCATFKGDPGAWAALNLLRRGDKSAMPRALALFKDPVDSATMRGVPHRNLQHRLIAFIANSCAASSMPIPKALEWNGWEANTHYKELLKWWESNQELFTPHDPWFAELAAQKID